ncbi:hypothetical protein RB195_003054 [Necator americanus]|uniref:Uncharacterized protein n=1 Tax=Necator americanus TaxID=51031 RepID=A0ABR1DLU2_NECAM
MRQWKSGDCRYDVERTSCKCVLDLQIFRSFVNMWIQNQKREIIYKYSSFFCVFHISTFLTEINFCCQTF